MDETQPAGGRRRTTAIIAAAGLACLAIAIPVSGAFGAGEGKDGAATQSQQQRGQGYGPQDGYGGPPPGFHGRRGDCPKHRGGSQSPGGQNQGTYAPGTPGDSVEL
jgi:hypothetical protein